MPQELVSKCPEIPAPLIDPIRIGRIRSIVRKNQATITALLVLTPSITIPAHYDWRDPIIGMILGGLSMAGITVLGIEQMVNVEREFAHLKPKNNQE